jgi:3-methyladenine DNA glycosylase Mpg
MPPERPAVSRRVGLAVGKGDDFAWRFAVPGDPNVSRPRPAGG